MLTKMFLPGFDNFISVFLDDPLDFFYFYGIQPIMNRERYYWLQPELGFSIR